MFYLVHPKKLDGFFEPNRPYTIELRNDNSARESIEYQGFTFLVLVVD